MKGGPQPRVSSPAPRRSPLITSAPRSASTWPAHGPARMRASSSTRRPDNGPGIVNSFLGGRLAASVARRSKFVYMNGAIMYPMRSCTDAAAVPTNGMMNVMNTSFFGELLQTISERGRALVERTRGRRGGAEHSESLVDMCEELVSVRGEASGTALARDILFRFAELTTGPRIAFFEALAHRFGPDLERLDRAAQAWRKAPSDAAAAELHSAAEPRRQELPRRLNLAPGGTKALVTMRERLMDAMDHRDDLAAVDADFV